MKYKVSRGKRKKKKKREKKGRMEGEVNSVPAMAWSHGPTEGHLE